MGLLVNGAWQEDISRTKDGRFIRPSTSFRNFVTADGSAGPTGEGGFAAEAGRYHLYVSLACPWAHRTLIFRALKKLDDVDFGLGHRTALRQDRLGIRHRARRHARYRQRQGDARRNLSARRSALYRPRLGPGVVGQEAPHHRQQRIVRNHPHAQFGVRGVHRRAHRLLSGRIARRDRPRQRSRLSERQQRRLPRRFCHQPGGLRRSRARRFRGIRSARSAPVAAALSGRDGRSPKRTGGCSPRSFGSTPFITAISNAICGASPTIPICGTTCAISIRRRASPRPSASITSNGTITAASVRSIRPASCRSGR